MSEPNKIAVLPIWKRDGTLAERLEETAGYVRAHPERFERFVMCFIETLPNGNLKVRTMTHGCDLAQQIGLFELGKQDAIDESHR